HHGPPSPVGGVAVDRDSRFLTAGAHRDYAVILLSIKRVEPELLAIERSLKIDHDPVFLEPFVDQLEQSGARGARFVDVTGQARVDRGLLLFGQTAVIPSLRLEMPDAARRRNSVFTDDHGHVAVARHQVSMVA